jgi:hypothetical protein
MSIRGQTLGGVDFDLDDHLALVNHGARIDSGKHIESVGEQAEIFKAGEEIGDIRYLICSGSLSYDRHKKSLSSLRVRDRI